MEITAFEGNHRKKIALVLLLVLTFLPNRNVLLRVAYTTMLHTDGVLVFNV